MKLSSTLVKNLTLGAIFGGALLFGFGAQEANAQVYQGRYNGGYGDGYSRQNGHHRKHEKQDLKDHQRDERAYYGNGRALREHQREERHQLKHHQRNERSYGQGRYHRDGYYDPYNY